MCVGAVQIATDATAAIFKILQPQWVGGRLTCHWIREMDLILSRPAVISPFVSPIAVHGRSEAGSWASMSCGG